VPTAPVVKDLEVVEHRVRRLEAMRLALICRRAADAARSTALRSWGPTASAGLRALHESGPVEIHWLTTWAGDADRLLAEPMGLPRGLTGSSTRSRRRCAAPVRP
jgi:hypothetical protein